MEIQLVGGPCDGLTVEVQTPKPRIHIARATGVPEFRVYPIPPGVPEEWLPDNLAYIIEVYMAGRGLRYRYLRSIRHE